MISPATKSPYAGYRFPPEVISHAVRLYFRFPLSLRTVEEMLAARGIIVSHESVRQWALKLALDFLPAVKDWMAEAATRPGISGRRDRARLNEGGLWPTAPLVRRGLGQRELAAAAAHRPPQAAGRRHCVRHAHRSGPALAGPHSGCGTWDRSAQPPAPSGRQRCATGPGQHCA